MMILQASGTRTRLRPGACTYPCSYVATTPTALRGTRTSTQSSAHRFRRARMRDAGPAGARWGYW
eukprot:scaffold298276_cov17-Prasinocladus_malaysianus.AAC.1